MMTTTARPIETSAGVREFTVTRTAAANGGRSRLVVHPALDPPPAKTLLRLQHAFELRAELEGEWAARPLKLVERDGRHALLASDPGGVFLDHLLGAPMAVAEFLRLAS